MGVELCTVTPDDWRTWRLIRLAALAEAPSAFSSRLEDWVDADEGRWRERLSIPGAADFLARDTETSNTVGMVTGILPAQDGTNAELISMWVDPAARKGGVATALITAVADWAARNGAQTLSLLVMPDNETARRTYEKNGFTTVSEPGRPGIEIVMTRTLNP